MVLESSKLLFVFLGLLEAVAIIVLSPVDSGNKRITSKGESKVQKEKRSHYWN